MSDLTHRKLAHLRILDDWATFAKGHPEINFGCSQTEADRSSEIQIADAIKEFENGASLLVVSQAFQKWKEIQVEQAKPQTLFK
jgi:hypothetical protein